MIKKLSLAAIVAMGSMSVASATDLSDSIKGVDLSGFLRLRVYNDTTEKSSSVTTEKNTWRTSGVFKFTVPVDESMKVIFTPVFDQKVYGAKENNEYKNNNAEIKESKLYLQYSKSGATVIAGKIPVVTPVTGKGLGEATGAGAIATYKVGETGLTVAAAGIDALFNTDKVAVNGNNTYAAAAIYSNKDMGLKAELWEFAVQHTIKSDTVVRATYSMSGATAGFDYAIAKLYDKISKKTQSYWNLYAGYKMDGYSAKIGYAATGKDGGTVVLDSDAPIVNVTGTELGKNIANKKDASLVYAKVSAKVIDKTSIYANVALASLPGTKTDWNEYKVGAKYKYSKKLGFNLYYDMLDNEKKDSDKTEARFEAKYKF